MPTDINSIQTYAVCISALITALTGFFIVQTFVLQAKSSIDQSRITGLEIERSLMEKRPLFMAVLQDKRDDDKRADGDDGKPFTRSRYYIELRRNDIYDLQTELIPHDDLEKVKFNYYHDVKDFSGMIEGDKYVFIITVNSEKLNALRVEKGADVKLEMIINFKYKDFIGYQYTQKIQIVHEHIPVNYPPTIPALEIRKPIIKTIT